LVIFLCGGTFGSLVTRTYLHSRIPALAQPTAIEEAQRYGLEPLKKQLNLTPAQEQLIDHELDEYAKYYQNIEDEREDVAEHGRQRILAVLNAQQRRRFNELLHLH